MSIPGYDAWKLRSPDEEQDADAALGRMLKRRLLGPRYDRDPDDARDEQQDRDMRGED